MDLGPSNIAGSTLKNAPKIMPNMDSWHQLMADAGSREVTHVLHHLPLLLYPSIPTLLGTRKFLCSQFSTFCAINKAPKDISSASRQQMASAVAQGRFSQLALFLNLCHVCCLKCSVVLKTY